MRCSTTKTRGMMLAVRARRVVALACWLILLLHVSQGILSCVVGIPRHPLSMCRYVDPLETPRSLCESKWPQRRSQPCVRQERSRPDKRRNERARVSTWNAAEVVERVFAGYWCVYELSVRANGRWHFRQTTTEVDGTTPLSSTR